MPTTPPCESTISRRSTQRCLTLPPATRRKRERNYRPATPDCAAGNGGISLLLLDASLAVVKAGGRFPADFYRSSFGLRGDTLVWHTQTSIDEWGGNGGSGFSRSGLGSVIAVDTGGTRAALVTDDGKLRVVGLEPVYRLIDLDPGGSPIVCAAFSPRTDQVAAGTAAGNVQVWDIANRRLVKEFHAHDASVAAIRYVPDGEEDHQHRNRRPYSHIGCRDWTGDRHDRRVRGRAVAPCDRPYGEVGVIQFHRRQCRAGPPAADLRPGPPRRHTQLRQHHRDHGRRVQRCRRARQPIRVCQRRWRTAVMR